MVLAVDVDLRSEAMRQAATKKDTAAESCPESWARAPRGGGGRVYGGGKDSVPQRLVRKPRLCTRDHRLLVKSACGDGTGTGSLIRRRTGGLSLGLGLGLGSRGLGLGRPVRARSLFDMQTEYTHPVCVSGIFRFTFDV